MTKSSLRLVTRDDSLPNHYYSIRARDILVIFRTKARRRVAAGRKTTDKQSGDFRMGAFHPKN